MTISRISAISISILSITAGAVMIAQAPEIKRLEINTNRPLLVLPEHETDLRYFIEHSGKATFYWIANRGKQVVHFTPVWIMQDGKPLPIPEDRPYAPNPRIHISPYGRLHIIPPEGFRELQLTEIRIGDDTGQFIDIREGANQGGFQ